MAKFTRTVRWIIWGALFQAVVVYAVLIPVLGVDGSEEIEGNLPKILGVVGLITFAIGQGIGYFVNHLRTPEGRPKAFSNPDVAFIAALALTEIPAIMGLIIGMSGGAIGEYGLLFLLSIVGMLLLRPPAFYRIIDSLEAE